MGIAGRRKAGVILLSMKQKLLDALEIEKKGDWNKAHEIVQNLNHSWAFWIHAYLHRREPDLWNAKHWYSRAKKPMPKYSFEKEWNEIFECIKKSEE